AFAAQKDRAAALAFECLDVCNDGGLRYPEHLGRGTKAAVLGSGQNRLMTSHRDVEHFRALQSEGYCFNSLPPRCLGWLSLQTCRQTRMRWARRTRFALPGRTRMNVVGIDIGGTFTDLVGYVAGRIVASKTSTVPADPTKGISQSLDLADCDTRKLDEILHGSTIAINTVLEQKGARTAL